MYFIATIFGVSVLTTQFVYYPSNVVFIIHESYPCSHAVQRAPGGILKRYNTEDLYRDSYDDERKRILPNGRHLLSLVGKNT